jgi:hypothetical protein
MPILSPGVHGANWRLAGVRMIERRVVRGPSVRAGPQSGGSDLRT